MLDKLNTFRVLLKDSEKNLKSRGEIVNKYEQDFNSSKNYFKDKILSKQ